MMPVIAFVVVILLLRSSSGAKECPTNAITLNEKFFTWSRLNLSRYWMPPNHIYTCSQCIFPQDLRTFGFRADYASFVVFHPYLEGMTGDNQIASYLGKLRCGIRDIETSAATIYSTLEDRVKVIRTRFSEWSESIIDKADAHDIKDVDKQCYGAVCPLFFRLYGGKFINSDFNGYYVINFVTGTGGGDLKGTVSYKHTSKPLYLWANTATSYVLNAWPGVADCGSSRLEISVTIPTEPPGSTNVEFGRMAGKFCFPMHEEFVWKEIRDTEEVTHSFVQIEELQHPCGVTYKESENFMFTSGTQPFVVSIEGIPNVKCVGTLISPQHILTLASCFTAAQDLYGMAKNRPRCAYAVHSDAKWEDCPRWFSLNKNPDGKPHTVIVKPFKSPYDKQPDLPKIEWVEIHPLYNAVEYDLAVIGLESIIQSNSMLYPICLPKFDGDMLYPSLSWENHQTLFSIKAMNKDKRFFSYRTDVNGPSKYQRCLPKPGKPNGTVHIPNYCYGTVHKDKPEDIMPPEELPGDLRLDTIRPFNNEHVHEGLNGIMYNRNGTRDFKFTCQFFYDLLTYEEERPHLRQEERQIRGLQRNSMDCFSAVIITFPNEERESHCYERRRRCVDHFGWCYTGDLTGDFGFCGESNFLPDKASDLFEVPTYIYPKSKCEKGALLSSPSRICTGHITKAPSSYTFEVVQKTVGHAALKAVFRLKSRVGGMQRPMVKAPDDAGRMRPITNALEATCHGEGTTTDWDNGAPTYFRYPINEAKNGQDQEPGNAYAVLYSLQKMTGRFCDFKEYHDTEVLVAHKNVIDWLSVIVNEKDSYILFYDFDKVQVEMDFHVLTATTKSEYTRLHTTTTDFDTAWRNSPPFNQFTDLSGKIKLPEDFPMKLYWTGGVVSTKPPLVYLEGYPDVFGSEEDRDEL